VVEYCMSTALFPSPSHSDSWDDGESGNEAVPRLTEKWEGSGNKTNNYWH